MVQDNPLGRDLKACCPLLKIQLAWNHLLVDVMLYLLTDYIGKGWY